MWQSRFESVIISAPESLSQSAARLRIVSSWTLFSIDDIIHHPEKQMAHGEPDGCHHIPKIMLIELFY